VVVRYRLELVVPGSQRTITQVAEDAQFLAYTAVGDTISWLDDHATDGLLNAAASGNVTDEVAQAQLQRALDRVPLLQPHLVELGDQIAARAVTDHRKVRQSSGTRIRGLSARLLPPPDVLGVYVYLPGGPA